MTPAATQPSLTNARDPVCGMEIEAANAFARRHWQGTDVYLCSPACAARFDA
jgi:YHS domain-containing protein